MNTKNKVRKVRIVIEGTYDILPENYPNCKTFKEMLELDKNNPNFGVHEIVDALGDNVEVKFELLGEGK